MTWLKVPPYVSGTTVSQHQPIEHAAVAVALLYILSDWLLPAHCDFRYVGRYFTFCLICINRAQRLPLYS